MNNVKHALAALVRRFGFQVTTNIRDGLEMYWGLYTQGSGVCFRASIGCYKPMVEAMRTKGELDTAATLVDLIENHGLKASVTVSRGNYTHAQMMDIETEGPTTDQDNWDYVNRCIEQMRETLTELKDAASQSAYRLIEDYDMLRVSQPIELRTITTRHYRVEVKLVPNEDWDEHPLNWELEGMSADDAIEVMRQVTAVWRQYQAGDLRATVYYREEPEFDSWDEVTEFTLGGGVDTIENLKRTRVREVAAEAIIQARNELNIEKTLMEAA